MSEHIELPLKLGPGNAIVDSNGVNVAYFSGNTSHEVAESIVLAANAHKDLLAACEKVNEALDCALSQGDSVELQEVLEAAIAKGKA